MKAKTKKILASALAVAMVFAMTGTSIAADISPAKEETVYAVLNSGGSVSGIYVVNSYDAKEAGRITDYGDYTSVRNMTTEGAMDYSDGAAGVNIPVGRFYYQGNLNSKELPWSVAVTYSLDGQTIAADDLAGKSGALEITIDVKKNDRVNETFFENYALQISLALSMEKCGDIAAEGATLANAGKNKSITFTHLPNTEKTYTIKSTVRDFEMDPIQLSGILLKISLDAGIDGMTSDFTKLADAIKQLNSGASQLKFGAIDFGEGLSEYLSAVKELSVLSAQIASGLRQSATGLSQTLTEAADLKLLAASLMSSPDPQVRALAGGYLDQAAVLEEISAGLSDLSARYVRFDQGLSRTAGGGDGLAEGYEEIDNGIGDIAVGINQISQGTSSLDTHVQSQISEMISQYSGKDFKPVSFVSDKNTNVKAVQFIIRTQGIQKAQIETQPEETPKELSFWDRLLKLFGLYRE